MKSNILISSVFLLISCTPTLQNYIEPNYNVIISHKGNVIKKRLFEYAIQQISYLEYCEDFTNQELTIMPNLKYRLVNPEIKFSVLSGSYRLVGYVYPPNEVHLVL